MKITKAMLKSAARVTWQHFHSAMFGLITAGIAFLALTAVFVGLRFLLPWFEWWMLAVACTLVAISRTVLVTYKIVKQKKEPR